MIEQRSSATSAVARTVNHFDRSGRLTTTEIDEDGDGGIDQVVTRSYDGGGRLVETREAQRTRRLVRDRDGRVVARETEVHGRLVDRVEIRYDAGGHGTREVGDLDDVRYAYDAAGCTIREQHYRPGDQAPYIDLEMRCDDRGHRIARWGRDATGAIRQTWRYNTTGDPIQAQLVRDGQLVLDTTVSYDAAGHRIQEEYRDAHGTVTGRRTWSYDVRGDVRTDQIEDMVDGSWTRNTYAYPDAADGADLDRHRCSS